MSLALEWNWGKLRPGISQTAKYLLCEMPDLTPLLAQNLAQPNFFAWLPSLCVTQFTIEL